MKLTKEQAKENLKILVEKFAEEFESGRAMEYNEEATKMAFIEPFLKDVLGWDVSNNDEVSPEYKVSRKRVDYGLKIDGKMKMFVEAKPIKADLDKHIEQAVRYGYNRKDVPFVLLTDFEGVQLFDVTIKPSKKNIIKGLKLKIDWKEYNEKFEKLWLLSKESVLNKEIETLLLIKPKNRITVDKAILDDLQGWRESLSKDMYKNNLQLFHTGNREKDAQYLKEVTQKLLDRIIFMRFCEDRGLVHERKLNELFEERTDSVGTKAYIFLKELTNRYNLTFNSDLFRPQDWEEDLKISFTVIEKIIQETYDPYQFDVIPLEVLGNIYEQYLGYTIRLTEQQVKYELKPDVRKAGGVYYTPEYIVDYIVRNTVGKHLNELSPTKIKELRILDPACGSGSFLIRAYEEMLKYYTRIKTLKRKEIEGDKLDLKHQEVDVRLTIQEKSEILRNHIFGVDIDDQAVEMTKLSLMLKMLDGEYGIIAGRAILPMLDKNIRCGNSLISGDVLELKNYFGDKWYKVMPLNWEHEFRNIIQDEQGFDVVIGNPPWGAMFNNEELSYLKDKYQSIIVRMIDSFMYFVFKGEQLLNKNGHFGMILPDVILYQKDNYKLREMLLEKCNLTSVINLGNGVFEKVNRPSCILCYTKKIKRKNIVNILDIAKFEDKETMLNNLNNFEKLKQSFYKAVPNNMFVTYKPRRYELYVKIKNRNPIVNLINFIDSNGIQRGVSPDLKKAFIVDEGTINTYKLEKTYLRPVITGGRQIKRYFIDYQNQYLIYTKRNDDFKKIPNICKYINQFQNEIKCVEVKTKKHPLYSLHRPRIEDIFIKDSKFVGVITEDELILSIDRNKFFVSDGCYLFGIKDKKYQYYILAILNSKLFKFIYRLISQEEGRVLAQVKPTLLAELPIRDINFGITHEIKYFDNVNNLVKSIFNLYVNFIKAKGSEKEQILKQIHNIENEIDRLVYQLYGITEEEREIIEEDL